MPSGWIHGVIDLIAYGKPYFDMHKEKDMAYKILGRKHRIVNHEWYREYGKSWSFREPFPARLKGSIRILKNKQGADKSERQMAYIDHDYIDRVWDTLSSEERKYCEGFFAWVLCNPEILKKWGGVDVVCGKIQRLLDGYEIWEVCPDLKSEYKRLRKYVETVIERDKTLKTMIDCYGRKNTS